MSKSVIRWQYYVILKVNQANNGTRSEKQAVPASAGDHQVTINPPPHRTPRDGYRQVNPAPPALLWNPARNVTKPVDSYYPANRKSRQREYGGKFTA